MNWLSSKMLSRSRFSLVLTTLLMAGVMVACSSTSRPKPAELPNLTPKVGVRQAWTVGVGESGLARLAPAAVGTDALFVANQAGKVRRLNVQDGRTRWETDLGRRILAGVAVGDGVAVVTTDAAEIVALDVNSGKVVWRTATGVLGSDLPAIVDGVVIARLGDNRSIGLDAANGRKRWTLARTTPSLMLQGVGGVATTAGSAWIGQPEGRILAVVPNTGSVRWETVASPARGVNEIERLSDILGSPVLEGRDVCVSAYRQRIACMEAATGRLNWQKDLAVNSGPAVDGRYVFVADDGGRLRALYRQQGENAWTQDLLQLRELTTPLSHGSAVIVGDNLGQVHWFARENGAPLARFSIDKSPIRVAPMLVGDRVIVQSSAGNVVAFSVGP